MSKITDDELARLRARVGKVIEARDIPYLTEVTRDAIRHWAHSTGDRNPLYTRAETAAAHGQPDVIGPPSMLYAFSRNATGYNGGLPGVHSVFGGSHWKWHRRLDVGTSVSATTRFDGIAELNGNFSGRMMKQLSTTSFTDRSGAALADVESWSLRYERGAARERNKDALAAAPKTEPSRLTSEQIASIAADYRAERESMGKPVAVSSLQLGAALPAMIRGPYSSTCAVAFEQAWGGAFIRAHGYWYEFLERHPRVSLFNEEGVPESPEAVHWDSRAARRAGVKSSYDFGPERMAWAATFVTNWAGTNGFLSQLYCEVRRFNTSGNILRFSGEITSLEPQDAGSVAAKVKFSAADQDGHTTAFGWAEVLFDDPTHNNRVQKIR